MTTLTFDAPARLLTLNDRLHHMARNRIVQAWRKAAAVHALNAKTPKLDRAHITVTIGFRDSKHRDTSQNYAATTKAIVDGLVDAGVVPDDCDCFCLVDTRRGPKTTAAKPQIEVRIEPLDPSDSTGGPDMPEKRPQKPTRATQAPSRVCADVREETGA